MRCILSILLCVIVTAGRGQDSHFSNFQNAYLYYNPSTAGILSQGDFRVSNVHRRQWKKIVSPARSMNLSVDLPMLRYEGLEERKSFYGIGMNIYSEKFGSSGSGVFDASLKLMGAVNSGRSVFSLGISAGTGRRKLDLTNLTWDSQFDGYEFDGSLPTNESSGSLVAKYKDVSTGMSWVFRKRNGAYSHLGIAYHHVTSPKIEYSGYSGGTLLPKMIAHWKAEIPVSVSGVTPLGVTPHVMVGQQGPHLEMLAGSSVNFYLRQPSRFTGYKGRISLELGAAYRYGDAVVLLMNYHHHNYNLGISYDITTSDLRRSVSYRGGIEVSFTYYGTLEKFYTRRGH